MTQPGIEPQSPRLLANTLPIRLMGRLYSIYSSVIDEFLRPIFHLKNKVHYKVETTLESLVLCFELSYPSPRLVVHQAKRAQSTLLFWPELNFSKYYLTNIQYP